MIARGGETEIDPDKHRLLIHGLVRQSMVYTLDALHRYPMVCASPSLNAAEQRAALFQGAYPGQRAGAARLCSCAEWTGVMLSTLLEEFGVDPKAKWFIAEGADLPTMNRSIPLAKAMDDAMIALYQNGERIDPSNGYPTRLLLPGYEGNMNVKWLRRIKLVESPVMAINETKQYTILRPDGKAWQFYFPQEVKSFITYPSPGLNLKGPGFYEISGISYSGNGRISKVDVSADGGKSWAQAALQTPVLSKAFTRFRIPWNWDGRPVLLQSRATDEAGNVQPTREALIAERGPPRGTPNVAAFTIEHLNAISSWESMPRAR